MSGIKSTKPTPYIKVSQMDVTKFHYYRYIPE